MNEFEVLYKENLGQVLHGFFLTTPQEASKKRSTMHKR